MIINADTPELLNELKRVVSDSLAEDRPTGVCLTSLALIPADATLSAIFNSRKSGVLAGAAFVSEFVSQIDNTLKLELLKEDGASLAPKTTIATLKGNARSILALERPTLNLLSHLSGISTLTAQYRERIEGLPTTITDTRKTTPGLRYLEKYAVQCGGGANFRTSLSESILIKDNHLGYYTSIDEAVVSARHNSSPSTRIEVEVDSIDQLQSVLETSENDHKINLAGILLDNMELIDLRKAVALTKGRIPLTASGGVTLDTVRAIAETGVERIAIGALTHSAPSLDIGLDLT